MTAIRVAVTAEDIEAAGPINQDRAGVWAQPLETALARLTGQDVDVDSGDATGCVATIGQGEWTLVIDLPGPANAWLDARWTGDTGGEPIAFYLEIPAWLEDLIRLGYAR